MRKVIALLAVIVVLVALGISGCSLGIAQAPTATPTPTRTPKPTFTPLPTDTPTPEATPTPTDTPTSIPTDTPMATPTATNTPIPPPTPTSPPAPPTATPTPTPTPVVYACSYVEGSREKATAGKPAEGTMPSSVFEGYVIDAAGNPLNNYGVWFEHPSVGTACVFTGDPSNTWPPGFWKHEFWGPLGVETIYYLTIKGSCAPGAPALSTKEDFRYKWWASGHQFNITFICNL